MVDINVPNVISFLRGDANEGDDGDEDDDKNVCQMEHGVESWWMYFVWCLEHSFHGIRMPFRQDPKSGIEIFTQKIYTRLKILN